MQSEDLQERQRGYQRTYNLARKRKKFEAEWQKSLERIAALGSDRR